MWLAAVVHVVFQIAGLSLEETFVAVIIQIKMRVQFMDMNGVKTEIENKFWLQSGDFIVIFFCIKTCVNCLLITHNNNTDENSYIEYILSISNRLMCSHYPSVFIWTTLFVSIYKIMRPVTDCMWLVPKETILCDQSQCNIYSIFLLSFLYFRLFYSTQ